MNVSLGGLYDTLTKGSINERLQHAVQAQGMKAYAAASEGLPASLVAYKHAKAKWEGTDNGAYDTWVRDKSFLPLGYNEGHSA